VRQLRFLKNWIENKIEAIEFPELSIHVMAIWNLNSWKIFVYLVKIGLALNTPHTSISKPWSALDFEQVPGITDLGLVPRRVKKVAVLGGGLMGSGIATALILSNYPVILKEVNDQFLQAGIGRVRGRASALSWDQLLIYHLVTQFSFGLHKEVLLLWVNIPFFF